MNEQVTTTVSINPFIPEENTISCYNVIFCSFITNPYGRVHAVSVVIIHGEDRF